MSQLWIKTTDGQTSYRMGHVVSGTVGWELSNPANAIQLRLLWTTRGKGTVDSAVVDSLTFDEAADSDTRPFSFKLPAMPYSFEGKLVSLQWALSLVVSPTQERAQLSLVVSPTGQVVKLASPPG